MTVNGTSELTVSVPCATCGGTGIAERIVPGPTLGNGSTFITVCWDCNGTGVNRTPVTCAGCRWYEADSDGDMYCWSLGIFSSSNWGCLSWTAKEATDGNG